MQLLLLRQHNLRLLYHEVIFLRKKEVLLYVQALNQLYLQYQGVEGSHGISYGRESLG